jgi:hypothetical protein
MDRGKTKQKSDRKDGFLFLGNQLTLDFLNTRPVQNGESIELLPDFSTLLRWFQAAGLLSSLEAANLKLKMGRIGPSPAGCGVHEGTAGKIEKRDHRAQRLRKRAPLKP